ncbi:MAG: DUF2240 family protein [Candidatus Thorarchaeota archaeon]|jgi:hypothetical protein
MNGRDVLLILAHLFRKHGSPVDIEEAVYYLSFKCRYGSPTNVRRMLTAALENQLISLDDKRMNAEFLFDRQELSPVQSSFIGGGIKVDNRFEPLN